MAPRSCSTARRVAEAQARAEAIARERGLTWVHPYDDAQRHRRAGHHRARNAGGGARPRHAGDPDRRRRPDRRQRDRGASAINPSIEIVGVEAALYPSMWNALDGRGPAARRPDPGRRHRGQERRQADAADRARTGRRHRAGRRGASRARGQRLSHPAEDDGGRRRRRRPRRACWPSPSGSAAAASGSFCAAATSIRASSPRSWCASSSARTASSRSG